MDSVVVCNGCGRTLETSFLYCPWCGLERVGYGEDEMLDDTFSKLEVVAERGNEKKVQVLKERLDSLQNELEQLVLLSAGTK